jgi:phosphoglycolate phosphatase-like HAD superfamily hydrolase
MRLAFDLDGTVADMHSALVREARRLFPGIDPSEVPTSATPERLGAGSPERAEQTESSLSIGHLSSRQQSELWKAVCDQENWWETLAEIEPGALARLYRLVKDRKWELMFVTSRPETRGDTAQAQS